MNHCALTIVNDILLELNVLINEYERLQEMTEESHLDFSTELRILYQLNELITQKKTFLMQPTLVKDE